MYGSSVAAASASTSPPKPAHVASPCSASSTSPSGSAITPAALGYFCIYNPDFGPTDETQHEQLLYYVARKTVSIDAKMRNIGLAQGLVNFARIFSPTAPCENVHSQKNRLVFYEAEPGYWLHLSIELGMKRRSVKDANGQIRIISEYLDQEVHDTVISELLRQAYAMYRVANGTMDSLVTAHEGNTRPLQRRLEEFFESWVLGWNFEKSMTLERALDGINYLPLSRAGHQSVDRLVRTVREKYRGQLTHTMVTFEDQLVSSDIRDEDMRTVWKQIVQLTGYEGATANNLAWDKKEEEETKKRKTSTFKFGKSWSNTSIFGFYKSSPSTSTPPSTPPLRPTSRVGSPAPSIRSVDGIICGADAALGVPGSSPRASGESGVLSANGGKAQAIPLWFGEHIASEEVDEHIGFIYKHKSGFNLAFFAPVNGTASQPLIEEPEQFTQELEDYLTSLSFDPPFLETSENASKSLLDEVSRQVVKDAITARGLGGLLANDKEIRFLYFNKMNLAIKAQLNSPVGKGGLNITPEIALSLLDIKQDFERLPDTMEITTRSPSGYWIVGKRFDDREVYMIVSRKDSTLVEVEDEVRKLTSLYFNSNTLSSAMSSAPATIA